jgi:hypothetical protein
MRKVLLLALLTACGGSDKKPAQPEPAPSPRADAEGVCLKMFQKQRECTDVFIPALVGWRVELDVPAGVAAEDASAGRDALVAKANEEWAASNSDSQLATLCTSLVASVPDEQLAPQIDVANRCAAATACEDFVACVEPMQRQRLEAQKAAPPAE